MAHFAKLDDNNVVLEVNALSNHELVISKNTVDENGNVTVSLVESEDKGIAFLTAWSGGHTNWKQTSYNATFRGKFAGIGDTYDADANEFRAPVVVNSPDVLVVEPVAILPAAERTGAVFVRQEPRFDPEARQDFPPASPRAFDGDLRQRVAVRRAREQLTQRQGASRQGKECPRLQERDARALAAQHQLGARVALAPVVREAVDAVRAQLAGRGRVLLRKSGTEPLVRVMVEARDAEQARRCAQRIADTLQ